MKTKLTSIALIILSLVCTNAKADNTECPQSVATEDTTKHDTLVTNTSETKYIEHISDSVSQLSFREKARFLTRRELSYSPIPLMGVGFLAMSKKNNFRAARNSMEPRFESSLDNYLQYSPLAISFALKAVGYEGRSSWGRFLASGSFSYAIMAIITNGMKYSIREMRPDGSTRNSFPSGHTATAFVAATILHKEYGLTRSPWISAAGYALAMTTGVMRSLNNRHWISDIMVGAGIGIFSADLGYFIGDVIFKEKGIRRITRNDIDSFHSSNSYFNIAMGFGFFNDIKSPDFGFKTHTSTQVSAELSYFVNKYIGVGGRLRINSMPVGVTDLKIYDSNTRPINTSDEEVTSQFSVFSGMAGMYGSYPISRRFCFGAKVLVGQMVHSKSSYAASTLEEYSARDEVNLSSGKGFAWGAGVDFAYFYRNSIAWRLNIDYEQGSAPFTMNKSIIKTHSGDLGFEIQQQNHTFSQQLRSLSIGASMNIMF